MKKYIYLLVLMISISNLAHTQNYLINFAATGATSTVESVHVKNLTQNTTLVINGSDVLNLKGSSDISDNEIENECKIYPNPMIDYCNITINSTQNCIADISICDVAGKRIFSQEVETYVGLNNYLVYGLPAGYYVLSYKNNYERTSRKILSLSTNNNIENIMISVCDYNLEKDCIQKNTETTVEMQYNDGEVLLFEVSSGIYTGISTLIPTQNQTLTTNFVECTDGDGNNYSVVTICDVIWMAENLKTTTLNDGTPIADGYYLNTEGDHIGELTWIQYTEGSQQQYIVPFYGIPSEAYKNTYGAVYNNFAVQTKKLCPNGWHVPTTFETQVFFTECLGSTYTSGAIVPGMISTGYLENNSGYWPYPNSCATNSLGFSALPNHNDYNILPSDVPNYRSDWWIDGVAEENYNTFNGASAITYIAMASCYLSLNTSCFTTAAAAVRCIKD